jgi:energy-coupling factor transporter ATP-binding protein EcfA2
VVSIKYKVGSEPEAREWAGSGDDAFISRVSVFDTQCAAVYLTEKTDVAFRPFGLDLFDKLVKPCKAVRANLESEQRTLESSTLTVVQAQIPEGTAAARLLTNITSLTKPATVQALARLSPEEEAGLGLLEKSLLDLRANDPEKLAQQLNVHAGRVRALARHLKAIEAALSAQAVTDVIGVRTEADRKSEEAKRLREATFTADVLTGTGSESWTELWEAARQFSQEGPYPGQPFPVVTHGAHCVLCQQGVAHAASDRLKKLEELAASKTERELRKLKETFFQRRKTFADLRITTEAVDDTVREIRIEHESLADAIATAIATNENRRKAIILVSPKTETSPIARTSCPLPTRWMLLQSRSSRGSRRCSTALASNETRIRMIAEAQELNARKLLAKHEQTVLDEIERKKRYAAYGLCIDETKSHTITQKSTAITKTAVSKRLKDSFQDELGHLGFRHVEVELREAGGTEGVLYHKLVLKRAPGGELPKVVSEGEQRCLSIAAFFAELSTADDPSGIVFDDPVSSLDYKWREGVARRLVQEAKTRQVIVFTHDVVFLLHLKQFAKELNVEQFDQHVRHFSNGAGVCTEELPRVALPVKRKIGHLKNEYQAADKLFRDGQQSTYEKEAKHLYGLLREAWERALEEVLLNGIVERFRPGVQTQQIATIADITLEDCRTLDAAMTKCSRWLTGHDQAAAARAAVPEPTELKGDIETLENWVAAIRKRRPN